MPVRRGYSLVELLVTLAVVGVLLGLGAPRFEAFLADQNGIAVQNQMLGAVAMTRHAAVMLRTTATLCPSTDAERCGDRDTWHEGALIFADRNENGRRDGDEALVRGLPGWRHGRVYWRSFRNKRYLSFNSRGLTDWQNGHFLYCPDDGDPRFARQAIINAQGRARHARDTDGDGVREDASGDPLRCP